MRTPEQIALSREGMAHPEQWLIDYGNECMVEALRWVRDYNWISGLEGADLMVIDAKLRELGGDDGED